MFYTSIMVIYILALVIQLSNFLEDNSIFIALNLNCERLSKISTVKLVICIAEVLDKFQGTDWALCDKSRAFDCVDHDVLINKLEIVVIQGKEPI